MLDKHVYIYIYIYITKTECRKTLDACKRGHRSFVNIEMLSNAFVLSLYLVIELHLPEYPYEMKSMALQSSLKGHKIIISSGEWMEQALVPEDKGKNSTDRFVLRNGCALAKKKSYVFLE